MLREVNNKRNVSGLHVLGPPYTHSLAFRSTLTGKSVTVWPLPFLPHTRADKPAGR
jgi:hypothetical protein